MNEDKPKLSGGYPIPEPIDYDKPVGGLAPWYTMPDDDVRQPYFEAHDESSVRAEFGKNTFRLLRGMGTQALFSVFSSVRYVGEFAVAVVAVPIYDFGKHVYRKFWEGRP